MTRPTGAAIAAALSLLLPAAAAAQGVCLPRADLARHLAERFGEAAIAAGIAAAGELVEIFATPDGATWTIVVTVPGGPTCVVAVGRHWRATPGTSPATPPTGKGA